MRSEPRSVCGRAGKSCPLLPRHPSSLGRGRGQGGRRLLLLEPILESQL